MTTPERDSPDHLLADLNGIRSLLDDDDGAAQPASNAASNPASNAASNPADNTADVARDHGADPAAQHTDTLTERLIERGLAAAIEARIDATLTHFINDTLQIEFALLRARLLDAIRNDIEAFVSEEIRRASRAGSDHGQNDHGQ